MTAVHDKVPYMITVQYKQACLLEHLGRILVTLRQGRQQPRVLSLQQDADCENETKG
jgi:hypothetical protein